jgi:polar amino acid transport system substrate-binding protein
MRWSMFSAIVLITIQMSGLALGQSAPSSEIAPVGKLRSGTIEIQVVSGVAKPIGKFIAERLGASCEPIGYATVEAYVQSFGKGEWDIAIGPKALAPAEKSDLVSDLWLSDLIYVTAPGHEFANAGEVDRPGVKVGVTQASPSDRFLSRTLKSAEIVRVPLSAQIVLDAIERLRSGKSDVYGTDAGIAYQVTAGLAGAKIVPGSFTTVLIALALPKGRSSAAQAKVAEIVTEAKRTGVIQKAIEQAGLKSNAVRVAPD